VNAIESGRQTLADATVAATNLHGTGLSAKALTPVDSFAWDRIKR